MREEWQVFLGSYGHPRVFKLVTRDVEVDVEVEPFAHFLALGRVVALFGVREELTLVLPVDADLEYVVVVLEIFLNSISVVHVPVDNCDFFVLWVIGFYLIYQLYCIVHETKTVNFMLSSGMMSWRSDV